MPNKGYIKGSNLEYEVIEFLEAREYQCYRSAGSHGMADVTAFNRHNNDLDVDISMMFLWISCKYNTARMTKEQEKAFIDRATECGVLPVEAHRKKYKRIIFTDLRHERELFIDDARLS